MGKINAYGDCEQDDLGSGLIGCDKSNWGDLKGFVLARKGTSYSVTNGVAAITKSGWTNDIDGLKLYPYAGANDFDNTPGANEYNTSSTQVKRLVRNGLPEISFMYIDGNCRHKSLWTKQGFKKWDLILIYASGIRMCHNFDVSKVQGFDAGHFSVDTESIQKGTDLQMSKVTVQLLDADEFATRNAFFTWAELGFDAREIKGFNNINVTTDAMAHGTTFTTAAVASCNPDVKITTLDDPTDWSIGGTQASPTTISTVVYSSVTGKYTFTVTPATIAGDTIQPTTKRSTYTVATDISGERYKGKSNLITVT